MEKVDCFKYLGLLLSSDLSFSKHIESICSKSRKIIGLLYRRFNSANSDTLLQLYLAMVRPHLEYASPVWNPSTRKQVNMIEDVEKFAMKVVTRRWTAGYQEVLNMVNIPSIESRMLQSSMCTLYKIIHVLLFSRHCLTETQFSKRSDREFLLHQPFAGTKAFHSSFVPHATNIWNTLPERLVTSPFSTLKTNVMRYL